MNRSDSFYVVSMSRNADGGIYRYALNQEGLSPEPLEFTPVQDANYLCFSPDGKYLYSTCRFGEGGGVAAFRIEEDDSLSFLNSADAHGLSSCHVTCDTSGKFLYCANYRSGNFAEFALGEDGSIERMTQLIHHDDPVGPNRNRQDGPHTHCTELTPDGKYLCVVDLGIDAVKVYPLDPEKGVINEPFTCRTAPGDGPRHILFDRSGSIAYLINELGNSVTSLSYRDGTLKQIRTVTTLPRNCTAATKAAAIRFSPDGRFLFASNRGYDSIACYRIKGEGDFELYDIVPSFGSSPRDINFLPGGSLFAAANEFSDSVTFFDYDPDSGRLRFRLKEIRLTRPLNIEP